MGCCCSCELFEKPDTWSLEDEIRPGEIAAGFLYKRAKSSAVWSKRYFVMTGEKLIYYVERDRRDRRGEIVLAGATASVSSTRADGKKKFYFTINHPQAGMREFYAKTRRRRELWVDRINDVGATLLPHAVYGKLLKQGGLAKNQWQERWCVAAGEHLDYFENSTDNQPKGSIIIQGAVIKPCSVKDRHCFEISTAAPTRKGNKKYVFAVEKEHERAAWVQKLTALAALTSPMAILMNAGIGSPMHASNGTGSSVDDEGNVIPPPAPEDVEERQPSEVCSPEEMRGYLLKKSPAVLKGWQKRYFVTQPSGDLVYYKDESESNDPSAEARGVIRLVDIIGGGGGIDANENTSEITIRLQTKNIQLRAANGEEAMDWARNIAAWIAASRS